MLDILRKRGVALAVAPDNPVTAWLSLPRRIYLDTSTLQKLFDYGDVIFEGESFQPVGRAARVKGLSDELGALRMIFLVNERAMFELVVTEASLRESKDGTSLGTRSGSTTSSTHG